VWNISSQGACCKLAMRHLRCICVIAVLVVSFGGYSYPNFHVARTLRSRSLTIEAQTKELLQTAALEMATLTSSPMVQHAHHNVIRERLWIEFPDFFLRVDEEIGSFASELEAYLEGTIAPNAAQLHFLARKPTNRAILMAKERYRKQLRKYESNPNASFKEMCELEMAKVKLRQVEEKWKLANALEKEVERRGIPASAQEQVKCLLEMTKLASRLQPLVDAWGRRANE